VEPRLIELVSGREDVAVGALELAGALTGRDEEGGTVVGEDEVGDVVGVERPARHEPGGGPEKTRPLARKALSKRRKAAEIAV